MSSAISELRKRWLALAAIVVLLAVALATSTLFAANEREQQAEYPAVAQQSIADAADPGRPADLPAAPLAPERLPAQSDNNDEEEADPPPIAKSPPQYPNLDSNLNRLTEQAEAAQAAQQAANSADGGSNAGVSTGSSPMPNPVLVTFYVEPEQLAAVLQYLEDNDAFIRNVGEDWIEAHVPPALLPAASERPGVRRVDTVIPPEPAQSQGRTVSQGVALHQADKWHRMGFRGQGVKVGVIDTGYQGFSQMQGGELPRSVTARCYFTGARAPSSRLTDCEQAPCEEIACKHGTAVAETLVDVAPEVELYIANPMSRGDLRDAADWMAEQGVQVINMSLGWVSDGPGDGTSPFNVSPLKTIDAAVSSGITWVNSGGNSARKTWHGTFADPDGNGRHNFTLRNEGNHFFLPYDEDSPSRSTVTAFMRWDDSWGGADCDLDLHLVRFIPGPNNDLLVVSADTIEDGDVDDTPFAWLRATTTRISHEGTYYLVITKHACPNAPAWIQLTARMADNLQYYSPGDHIGNPAESRNTGMLAVAAAHWDNPGFVAPYSSRGPAVDGRIKPDITGIACGRSTVYARYIRSDDSTECWFGGTSQAAPHVAGLAALVRQRYPHYAPWQVAQYLKNNAVDRGAWGADSTWGHGLARLPVTGDDPPPLRGSEPITDFDVRPGENADEVVISWVPVPEATNYRIGYVNLEVDFHLATRASCTRESDDWLQAFVYVDVKAPNVPVRNGRAEYTIRRLSPGARHAFTVLSSNNLYNNSANVGADFSWPKVGPQKLRWVRVDGRRDLPPGIPIPSLDCPQ